MFRTKEKASKPAKPKTVPGAYAKKKVRERARNAEASREGREIGPLPGVEKPERREAGRRSLREFCEQYFPARFPWSFSESHLRVIDRLERCMIAGGRFAVAMPRGSGKTTLAEVAAIRALLYGLRRFAVLIQATQPLAKGSLSKIQREIESNDRLAADFPEVCYPVRSLERIHNRAKGQTLEHKPTRIEWKSDGLTLPTVEGSSASGAVLRVVGITGAVRGITVLGPSGEIMRPDIVLIDDVQTRESADSLLQTNDRETIILDDALGLAGPGVEISGVMLCTVIYGGDLSDRFLSPDKHPEWQGVRTKMVESFPTNMKKWDEYADIRRESFRSGNEGRRATDFYREHRDEMDAGGKVSWDERKRPGELSGLQSAMNLYIDNPRGFAAEYQNQPEEEGGVEGAKELIPDQVAKRISGTERLMIPRECNRVTAFIDVGGKLHWYCVVAWDEHFGGTVIDYGSWPRQSRSQFAAGDARPSLGDVYPGGESEVVFAGLQGVTAEILDRTYWREAGGSVSIDRCLIDCGWKPDVVAAFIRQSKHKGIIYPSKGIGRTTTSRGVSEWKPRPGEQSGHHWRLTTSDGGRGTRMIQFDPDAWKTFVWERFSTPIGGRGSMSLFGISASGHSMISEHCAAEISEPVTIRGASFDKWQVKPSRPDNHLWDTLVGCALGGSVTGLVFTGTTEKSEIKKKISVAELYKKAQERRE